MFAVSCQLDAAPASSRQCASRRGRWRSRTRLPVDNVLLSPSRPSPALNDTFLYRPGRLLYTRPVTRDEITRRIRIVLESHPEVLLAILYGSVARDAHRPDSDVDIGVAGHARTPMDETLLLDISLECSRELGREVQIRDLARAEGIFLKQVLTTGTILLSRDSTVYGELIVRMLAFVTDMLPNIRMIRRRGEEYFNA